MGVEREGCHVSKACGREQGPSPVANQRAACQGESARCASTPRHQSEDRGSVWKGSVHSDKNMY